MNRLPQTLPQALLSTFSTANNFSFPQHGWGINFEKMPLFTKAEMDRFISNSGKRLGSTHHSVPTSWRKGKTFLEDECLKNIECTSDDKRFSFRCKCHHSFRKNDAPHNIQLALCIIKDEVVQSTCSCVAWCLKCANILCTKAKVVTVGLLSATLHGPSTITSVSAPEVKKFVPSGCYEAT